MSLALGLVLRLEKMEVTLVTRTPRGDMKDADLPFRSRCAAAWSFRAIAADADADAVQLVP